MEKDPVCGMDVDAARTNLSKEYEGKRYHFCAPSCLKAFEANPGEFLSVKAEGHPADDRRGHRQAHTCD
ncbi:MAG: YHS domain-containing protein [Chloroflexi bacterium]|nr:YHS domain-containing protein [Chloroflexota bacterium]